MTTKKVYFIDRMWWDSDMRQILGDMGFTFCESSDTRTENLPELEEGANAWINARENDEERGTLETGFAIYEIHRADMEMDKDCDELWAGTIYDSEIISVYACAKRTDEIARELANYYGPDMNFNYVSAIVK